MPNKMMDMGYKNDSSLGAVPEKGENKTHYPTLYLSEKVPPELMDKDIGESCRIEIVGKVVSKGINEEGDNRRENLTIEINKMGYVGKAGKKTKEEWLAMNDKDRENYDKEDKKVNEDE